jgi:hypothetical protein
VEEQIDVIALVAERKILEAIAEGEFDNLKGSGQPLPEDDLANLPPDIRLAYRILRNSGYAETNDAGANPAKFAEIFSTAPEEGRMCRNITHLSLKLQKTNKKRGRTRTNTSFLPENQDAPLFESSYLEKIIQKIFR